jgi:hypothetical protein
MLCNFICYFFEDFDNNYQLDFITLDYGKCAAENRKKCTAPKKR